MSTEKIAALAKYLGCDVDEIAEESRTQGCGFSWGRREYLVCDDFEADQKARAYIEESVWAFRPEFIAAHSKLPRSSVIKICKALEDECEGSNEAKTALIADFDHFVDDAIKADGRGHFLAQYDSEEIEAGEFFIYRVN